MSGLGQNIRSLYFDYRPVNRHAPGCPREGSDVWEAAFYTYENFDGEVKETVVRFLCAECGAVAFFSAGGSLSEEYTDTGEIGFGSKPERCAGLWLHAGPTLWRGEGHGPSAFYVTRTKDRPRETEDLVGAVSWFTGPRGGIRWQVGMGATKYGSAKTAADRDFGSRRAAVAWIADRLDSDPEAPK